MSWNRHIHRYRAFLSTRQITESAAGRDVSRGVTEKISNAVNSFDKSKMSMQNQRKFLIQLKDFLSKSGYDKNLQFILSKDWIEISQRITYTQIDSIKKVFLTEFGKGSESDKTKADNDSESEKSLQLTSPQEQHDHINESLNEQKVQQRVPEQNVTEFTSEIKDTPYNFQQILATLVFKIRNKSKDSTLSPAPKWKVNVNTNIPKHSIISRTKHILNSIQVAESNASKWRRIEDLLIHIDQYPDARHYAIKENGIRTLLKARRGTKDEQIKASIREALAILGHIDPLPGHGIRILSIDGGGMRGVLVIEMLKKLEELTGKKTYEMFDYICGVSTGAILSAVIASAYESAEGGHKRKSLHEISDLYKSISTKIFTQSPLKGTSNLVWSHAYYDTALWEKMLQDQLGDKVLIKTLRDPNSPKFSAISAVVNLDGVMAYVFRNYTFPHKVESQYIGSHKHKLWEAVRASAAAPSYFEEFKFGDFLHQDGGILVNNPCAVAIHEAKQLWPNNPIQCVISFGTGRTPPRMYEKDSEASDVAISSWKDKFYKILDSATDTEAVHIMLDDHLPGNVYFRFNPYLTEKITMTEIRPEKIDQLEQDAKMYIRRNEEKFHQAAKALMKKRKLSQKFNDWIELQKKLFHL